MSKQEELIQAVQDFEAIVKRITSYRMSHPSHTDSKLEKKYKDTKHNLISLIKAL
jgi:CRISPR/Cas system CSM-associated protein Csm4 (group 5 of RAMP superfamily)